MYRYYFRFLLMISSALLTDFEHFMTSSRFCDLPMPILSVAFIGQILNATVTAVWDSCLAKNLNLLNILCIGSVPKDGRMLTYPHFLKGARELLKMCHPYTIVYGFLDFPKKAPLLSGDGYMLKLMDGDKEGCSCDVLKLWRRLAEEILESTLTG